MYQSSTVICSASAMLFMFYLFSPFLRICPLCRAVMHTVSSAIYFIVLLLHLGLYCCFTLQSLLIFEQIVPATAANPHMTPHPENTNSSQPPVKVLLPQTPAPFPLCFECFFFAVPWLSLSPFLPFFFSISSFTCSPFLLVVPYIRDPHLAARHL